MAQFSGRWKLVHSDRYDDFLKAIETVSSPILEISVNESTGTWQIKTEAAMSTVIVVFKLGEEFDDQRPGDGAKVPTKITMEGDKLIQKSGGSHPYTIIREVANEVLKTTMKAGDAVGIRLYQKVAK